MPLGPCLQSLCPLCNARSYPHPRTITGLSLAALWGQDAGRGLLFTAHHMASGWWEWAPWPQDPDHKTPGWEAAADREQTPHGVHAVCAPVCGVHVQAEAAGLVLRPGGLQVRTGSGQQALEFLQCSWRLFFLPLFSIHSCPRKWLLHRPRLRTSPTFLLPPLRPLVICR